MQFFRGGGGGGLAGGCFDNVEGFFTKARLPYLRKYLSWRLILSVQIILTLLLMGVFFYPNL